MNKRVKNLLLSKNSNIFGQVFRYAISGGIAFVVDFGLLWILTHFGGLNYLLSTIIAYFVGLVITYLMSILWIFDSRNSSSALREFIIFALIGLIGMILTWSLMWVFTELAQLYYLYSKVVVTVIVFAVNFVLKKTILFRQG